MAKTQKFASFALYAGGQGGCGIVFKDPYPDGYPSNDIVKVEFSNQEAKNVLNKIWNMKEWNVVFSAGISASASITEGTYTLNTDASFFSNISGKFYRGFSGLGYGGKAGGYFASIDYEPYKRICNPLFSARENEPVYGPFFFGETILPEVGGGLISFEDNSGSYFRYENFGNINADHSIHSYFYQINTLYPSSEIEGYGINWYPSFSISPVRIWIKDKDTINVYFSILFNTGYADDGGLKIIVNNDGDIPVQLNILGKTANTKATCYLETGYYPYDPETETTGEFVSIKKPAEFSNFNFSFDVEVSEYWEYKDED